jgi:peptide deformylase
MARLDILEYPDPRLRLRARPVTVFDADLSALIDDLFDTLYASKAIGLCAPQANDQRQVLVMDLSGNASSPQEYINPRIVWSAAPGIVEESCLSVPGVVCNVVRATQVRVVAQDRSGASFERELSGMDAVCLQHEMEHLEGRLLVDHLSWIRRLRLKAATRSQREAASAG